MGEVLDRGQEPSHHCYVERWEDDALPTFPNMGTIWRCSCGKVYEYRNGMDEDGYYAPSFYLVEDEAAPEVADLSEDASPPPRWTFLLVAGVMAVILVAIVLLLTV